MKVGGNMRRCAIRVTVIAIFLSLSLLFVGCKDVERTGQQSETQSSENLETTSPDNSKFDQNLHQALQDNESAELSVMVKCARPLDDDMKIEVEAGGLKVQTVAGNSFTARGSKEAIYSASKIDFIEYIQLTQQRDLLQVRSPQGGNR